MGLCTIAHAGGREAVLKYLDDEGNTKTVRIDLDWEEEGYSRTILCAGDLQSLESDIRAVKALHSQCGFPVWVVDFQGAAARNGYVARKPQRSLLAKRSPSLGYIVSAAFQMGG